MSDVRLLHSTWSEWFDGNLWTKETNIRLHSNINGRWKVVLVTEDERSPLTKSPTWSNNISPENLWCARDSARHRRLSTEPRPVSQLKTDLLGMTQGPEP